ncbi:MAG: hypothetical protein WC741_05240 [Patescibacteria group bacterium]
MANPNSLNTLKSLNLLSSKNVKVDTALTLLLSTTACNSETTATLVCGIPILIWVVGPILFALGNEIYSEIKKNKEAIKEWNSLSPEEKERRKRAEDDHYDPRGPYYN